MDAIDLVLPTNEQVSNANSCMHHVQHEQTNSPYPMCDTSTQVHKPCHRPHHAADAPVLMAQVAALKASLYGASANGYLKERLNAQGEHGCCLLALVGLHSGMWAGGQPTPHSLLLSSVAWAACHATPTLSNFLASPPACVGIATTNATVWYADIGTPYFVPPVIPAGNATAAAGSGSSNAGKIAGIAVGVAAALAAAAGTPACVVVPWRLVWELLVLLACFLVNAWPGVRLTAPVPLSHSALRSTPSPLQPLRGCLCGGGGGGRRRQRRRRLPPRSARPSRSGGLRSGAHRAAPAAHRPRRQWSMQMKLAMLPPPAMPAVMRLTLPAQLTPTSQQARVSQAMPPETVLRLGWRRSGRCAPGCRTSPICGAWAAGM